MRVVEIWGSLGISFWDYKNIGFRPVEYQCLHRRISARVNDIGTQTELYPPVIELSFSGGRRSARLGSTKGRVMCLLCTSLIIYVETITKSFNLYLEKV